MRGLGRRRLRGGFGASRLVLALAIAACAAPHATTEAPTLAPSPLAELARQPSPITMTADDGTPLPLRRLAVRAQLDELLAFTELDMVFANPEGRPLEAALALTLPADVRVTRFAVFEDGEWHDAEVVPRRAAYDELIAGDRSPALAAAAVVGDRLRARGLRIRPGATRIVVSYVEHLGGRERPYRLPLVGLPRLDELDIRLIGRDLLTQGAGEFRRLADGQQLFLRHEEKVQPNADFTAQIGGPRIRGLRHENMVVARVSPVPHDHADPLADMTLLFDTSASRALDFERQVDRLGALVKSMRAWSHEDIKIRVLCFDQAVASIYEGPISGFGDEALAAVRRRGSLGASNLVEALRYVGARRGGYERLVMITDGVVTSGAGSLEALRAEVGRLAEIGIRRVDAIGVGAISQPRLLEGLTRSLLPNDGLVLRGDLSPEVLVRKLAHQVHSGLELKVPGSEWVYPSRLDGIQADDTVLVFADLADDSVGDSLRVLVEGPHAPPPQEIAVAPATSVSLLEHAWSAAYVGWMSEQARLCEAEPSDLCGIWRRKIGEVSTRRRILNESTALAMLGKVDDYRRFGLEGGEPPAVLAFGQGGVESRPREPSDRGAGARALLAEPVLDPIVSERRAVSRPRAAEPWAPAAAEARAPRTTPAAAERRPSMNDPQGRPPRRWPSGGESPAPVNKPEVGPRWRPDDAWDGLYLAIMETLRRGVDAEALRLARGWRADEPADVNALLALGEAYEATGRAEEAARAYGSILDLYPTRPEMQRLAGERLERLGESTRHLVLDSYGRAIRRQPDSPSAHRLLGYALLRAGYHREAFETLVAGLAWARASRDGDAIAAALDDDVGLAAAAWARARPEEREYIDAALAIQGVEMARAPSLRFVLTWDTNLSDVDLHVRDGDGNPAYHSQPELKTGGRLYGDVKSGLGLEVFAIDGVAAAYPYNLKIFYPLAVDDPLGYGMGKVEVVEHDGAGRLAFDERPFVIQRDHGKLDLGVVSGPLPLR